MYPLEYYSNLPADAALRSDSKWDRLNINAHESAVKELFKAPVNDLRRTIKSGFPDQLVTAEQSAASLQQTLTFSGPHVSSVHRETA